MLALLASLVLFVVPASSESGPVMVYKASGEPVALVGLQEAFNDAGCSFQLGNFIVDSIAYEGTSNLVAGVRVLRLASLTSKPKDDDVPYLITIDTSKLSEADKGWIPKMVRRGSRLLISFNLCGSGGFESARDIYRADGLDWLSIPH